MQDDWKENAKIEITVEGKGKKVVLEMNKKGGEFLINELKKIVYCDNNCIEEFDGDTYESLGLLANSSYGLVIIKNENLN